MPPFIIPMLIGAGLGAISHPKHPFLGALGGGAMGGIGGAAMGGMGGLTGGGAAAGAGAAGAGGPISLMSDAMPTMPSEIAGQTAKAGIGSFMNADKIKNISSILSTLHGGQGGQQQNTPFNASQPMMGPGPSPVSAGMGGPQQAPQAQIQTAYGDNNPFPRKPQNPYGYGYGGYSG